MLLVFNLFVRPKQNSICWPRKLASIQANFRKSFWNLKSIYYNLTSPDTCTVSECHTTFPLHWLFNHKTQRKCGCNIKFTFWANSFVKFNSVLIEFGAKRFLPILREFHWKNVKFRIRREIIILILETLEICGKITFTYKFPHQNRLNWIVWFGWVCITLCNRKKKKTNYFRV